MAENSYMGYRDQEILIGAMTTYASTKINKSLNILKGMVRMSIQIVCDQKNVSLKNVKRFQEKDRDDFFIEVISVFFEKMNIDLGNRRKLKYDFLQIYERWKESKRQDISMIDPSIEISSVKETGISADIDKDQMNKTEKSETPGQDFESVEESELISDLDSLDLGAFDE